MLSLAQSGFFPGSFFFHPFKFFSSQMRKGKIDARVFLCFAFVYCVFEGWQDARRMNMMFDGGRGDGEHWCSHAGILRGLQSAHMIILMWCLRFHLLLNWHSHRWHLYSLRIKTSLFQCYPCYSCQGKPVAERREVFSLETVFLLFLDPTHDSPLLACPTQNLIQEDGSNWTESVAGNRIFPSRPFCCLCPSSDVLSDNTHYLLLLWPHVFQFYSFYMRFHKTDFPPNSVEELWKYENWCRAKK